MTRVALLIGCNYKHSGSDLDGCINDILNMKQYLMSKSYLEKNIISMTDDASITTDPTLLASKTNIFNVIKTIISTMKSGDTFIFHFSGHGGQIPDISHDEHDRKDETIYAMNLEEITDDELKSNLVNKIPVGCKLRCIIDACHSASSLDLPFMVMSSKNKYSNESSPCALSTDILCISGCKDDSVSADTTIDGKPSGALTGYLLKALKSASPTETWLELLTVVRYLLKTSKYSQLPQMSIGTQKLEKTVVDF